MYFTLFVTVLITAAFLVVAAYAIAKLIGNKKAKNQVSSIR